MPTQQFEYPALEKEKDESRKVLKNKWKAQRNSLLQTFSVHVDGEDEPYRFTAVVNHLKSKGSECFNDYYEYKWPVPLTSKGKIDKNKAEYEKGYVDDLQGSCNEFRVSAAEVLGTYLKDNTDGNVLLLGDFNSYAQEDPMRLLTGDDLTGQEVSTAPYTFVGGEAIDGDSGRKLNSGFGFTNLADAHKTDEYVFSYTYGGELGSLDHALASGTVIDKVVDVTDWHINSLENNLFEYSRDHSGDLAKSDNAFSSSDHDPVLIDMDLGGEIVAPPAAVEGVNTGDDNDDGGSFGFPMLGLGLLSLLGLRRRKMS